MLYSHRNPAKTKTGGLTNLEHIYIYIYIYICELYSCCVCAVHDMVISQANGWHPDLGLPTKAGCFDVMVTSSFFFSFWSFACEIG